LNRILKKDSEKLDTNRYSIKEK